MRDFSCCGKTLPTMHDLLQHYEESHAGRPQQQTQQNPGSSQMVPDSRAAIATNAAAAVQQQAQQQPLVAPQQVNGAGPTETNIKSSSNSSNLNASQLQSIPDMDTVEDMEMDDAIEEADATTPPPNLYTQAANQNTPQAQYTQSNQPRLAPLNINLLPQYKGFRNSTPTTPTTARTSIPLSNNPTVSSVNTPTLVAHPTQQHLQTQFRTPDSSAPGTPVELDENIMSGIDGMSMQGNMAGQAFGGGMAPFPMSNDMVDLCIDEPAKRLLTPSGGPGNSQQYAHFRLGGNQYSADSDIAKRIREQQMLAGVPDTVVGMMPNDEPKPFRCPVIGCEKAYKNQNGLKYHKSVSVLTHD